MLRVEGWSDQVRYVGSGWDTADRIAPLIGVRWEEGLDKPPDVWRSELNVEPIREGPNSCTRFYVICACDQGTASLHRKRSRA